MENKPYTLYNTDKEWPWVNDSDIDNASDIVYVEIDNDQSIESVKEQTCHPIYEQSSCESIFVGMTQV